MIVKYLQINPNSQIPDISLSSPFRSIIVIEEETQENWQYQVSQWLVKSGCLYMMTWGVNAESWHDSIDNAYLELYDYSDIPDNKQIITTWHTYDSLSEIFWYAKNVAKHPNVEIENTLILHISKVDNKEDLIKRYENE